ncbi:hypothetical protein G4B88_002242 [Cannabis sativa]|uniref:Chromo domain-containing protein n=1 Tax=Cannabis sativa TaxID=3483 RepID=A0A7J6FSW7_CANSA|nr:hypothetical protein G4B88_002242 [Cannabis sativa]
MDEDTPGHEDPEDPARNQSTRDDISIQRCRSREPEEILAKRTVCVKKKKRKEYLVKWKGRADDEISWEKAEDLQQRV